MSAEATPRMLSGVLLTIFPLPTTATCDVEFHRLPSVTTGADGRAFWSVGALMIVTVSGEQTGGEFALVDHAALPGWASPYHVHHGEDELFHVLSGEIEFLHGEDGANGRAPARTSPCCSRGTPTGFRVVSDESRRLLIHVTPSGFEEFAEAAGRPAESLTVPPQEDPDVAALSRSPRATTPKSSAHSPSDRPHLTGVGRRRSASSSPLARREHTPASNG